MRLLSLAIVMALFTIPAEASAQGRGRAAAKPCPRRWQAKRAFDKGHLAYRKGEYERAIIMFQDSYSICPMPLTTLAIAKAFGKLKDDPAELEHLQQYLPDAKPGEREAIEERIEELEASAAEAEREEREAAEREAAAEKRRREEEKRRAEERAAEKLRRDQAQEQREQLATAGWATGGAGVAVLIASAVTGGLALSLDGDLAEACATGRCPTDRGEDIDQLSTLSTATDVMLVVGAALTAGGVTMVLLSQPEDGSGPELEASLSPWGVTLGGRF